MQVKPQVIGYKQNIIFNDGARLKSVFIQTILTTQTPKMHIIIAVADFPIARIVPERLSNVPANTENAHSHTILRVATLTTSGSSVII